MPFAPSQFYRVSHNIYKLYPYDLDWLSEELPAGYPPNLNWKDQIHLLFVRPEKYFNLQHVCIHVYICIVTEMMAHACIVGQSVCSYRRYLAFF